MNIRPALLAMAVCITAGSLPPPSYAGDIATERTQWANSGLLGLIHFVEEAMRDIQENIERFEQVAGEVADATVFQWAQDVAPILQNVRDVYDNVNSIAYTAANIEERMEERFKNYEETLRDQLQSKLDVTREGYDDRLNEWSENFQGTLRGILTAQGYHAEQINNDTAILNELRGEVQSSQGRMQVMQTGQMIMNEQVNQMHKLKQILLEQTNTHAAFYAEKSSRESYRQAATTRVLEDDPLVANSDGRNNAGVAP